MSSNRNIIKVYFKGTHLIYSKPQYQYNHGMILHFADLNLPQAFEAHFANKPHGNSKTVIGSDNQVEIPDEYFWSGANEIFAWVYLHSDVDDGETVFEVRIPLTKRAKPSDEEPLPEQESAINRAIAELNHAVEQTGADVEQTNSDREAVSEMRDEVSDLKDSVEESANIATQKTQEASTSASNAEDSEQEAKGHADDAKRYAENAFSSKEIAVAKASDAEQAKVDAEQARDDAEDARSDTIQLKQDVVALKEQTDTNVTHYPKIVDEYWHVWDARQNNFVNTGVDAKGEDGEDGEKGDKGDTGNSGVYIGTEEPTDDDINVWIDTNGQPDSVTGLKYVKDDSSDNGGVIEGSVSGNNINVASGSYSHAEGFKTTASAYCSHAEGQQTVASAVFAHAEGYQTIAQSQQSHAEGMQTVAKGNMSHAEGYNNTAQGYVSHVEGQNSLASGAVSHAEGYNTTASGLDSHAEGESTIAQGNVSHAEGSGSKAVGGISHAEGTGCIANGTPSHAEGNVTTAEGHCSHSEGTHAVANGYASHAEGESTIANGQYQHVEGKYNVEDANGANGVYAHIVGGGTSNNNRANIHTLDWSGNAVYSGKVTVGVQPTNDNDLATKKYVDDNASSLKYVKDDSSDNSGVIEGLVNLPSNTTTGTINQATGAYSHAEGGNLIRYINNYIAMPNTASGIASHAEGINTTASYNASHAEGMHSVSSGEASHAEGFGTLASSDNQHIQGKYNIADSQGMYADIVGNGTSDNARSNAYTLDWNGNGVYSGKVTVGVAPTNDLDVATKKYVDDGDNIIQKLKYIFTQRKGVYQIRKLVDNDGWLHYVDITSDDYEDLFKQKYLLSSTNAIMYRLETGFIDSNSNMAYWICFDTSYRTSNGETEITSVNPTVGAVYLNNGEITCFHKTLTLTDDEFYVRFFTYANNTIYSDTLYSNVLEAINNGKAVKGYYNGLSSISVTQEGENIYFLFAIQHLSTSNGTTSLASVEYMQIIFDKYGVNFGDSRFINF